VSKVVRISNTKFKNVKEVLISAFTLFYVTSSDLLKQIKIKIKRFFVPHILFSLIFLQMCGRVETKQNKMNVSCMFLHAPIFYI